MIVLIYILLFIITITYEYKEDSKSLILKLYRDQILTSVDTSETMRHLQYNKIYINSKIGSNDKSIKLYLRFNEYITYITDNFYKKEDSNTYEFTRKKDGEKNIEYVPNEFHTDDLNSGYESKDVLKLDNNLLVLKNFNFILVDKLNKEKEFYYPIIGLNLVKENNLRPILYKTNLLEQLKNNDIITNKLFSILYFKKDNNNNDIEKGEIIFGKLPHELDINAQYKNFIFNENNLNWINAEIEDYNLKWKIKFDNIKYSNEELSDLTTELIIEQNLFTAPWEFKDIIHKKFFGELITKKICKEEKFYNYRDKFNYFFYSCESSFKSELSKDKYKNDILQFNSNNLNNIFIFNLEELFIEKGNKLYFSIIFDEYKMFGWKLGNIFFEKYPLVFSLDNKAIGYYNQNVSNINNKSNSKLVLILIGLVLLLLLIIFIGIRKYNILKKLIPRKLMANELLDNYSYNSHDNNNINDGNKNENEITTEMIYKNKSNENQEMKLGI